MNTVAVTIWLLMSVSTVDFTTRATDVDGFPSEKACETFKQEFATRYMAQRRETQFLPGTPFNTPQKQLVCVPKTVTEVPR